MTPPLVSKLRNQILWIIEGRAGVAAVIQTFVWRILLLGLNLVNGILVVRNIGPLGRGQQATMMLWPQILPAVLTMGIPYAMIYYARSNSETRARYYGTGLLLGVLLSFVAVLVGVVGIPSWLGHFDRETVHLAQILMIFAPASMLTFIMLSIIDSEHEFGMSNALRNFPTLLTTMILASAVLTHHLTPLAAAIAYLLPTTIALVVVGSIAMRRYKPSLKAFFETSKSLFSYGARVHGTTLIGTFSQQIDQVLVVGFLAPTQLGIYSVALNASRILNIFSTSLLNVLLAKIVGRPDQDVVELVARVSRLNILCTGVSGLVLVLILPILMPLIYGGQLQAGVIICQILTLEVVFSSTNWILMQSYLALNRPAMVTTFQILGLAIAIPLMLVLIPKIGLLGAAVALVASSITRFTAGLIGYVFILRQRMPNMIPRFSDITFFASSIRQKFS